MVAAEGKLLSAEGCEGCICTCHEALSGGFFITCGAVDLAGEIKAGDEACLESVAQLRGVEEVVFYGVSGSVDLHVGERRHSGEGRKLDIHRH